MLAQATYTPRPERGAFAAAPREPLRPKVPHCPPKAFQVRGSQTRLWVCKELWTRHRIHARFGYGLVAQTYMYGDVSQFGNCMWRSATFETPVVQRRSTRCMRFALESAQNAAVR